MAKRPFRGAMGITHEQVNVPARNRVRGAIYVQSTRAGNGCCMCDGGRRLRTSSQPIRKPAPGSEAGIVSVENAEGGKQPCRGRCLTVRPDDYAAAASA